MADLKKTIEIIFNGVDNLGGTVSNIRSSLSGLETGIGTIADPLASVAEGILAADAALTALAAGGLAYAYNKSVEFESAQIELKKVMGDQPAAIDAASRAAIDLSNTYGQAATDILASTADFKQAGFNAADAMILTRDAMDLVIAGSMEAGTASELLVSALKGFDAPASDARVLMDILNEVSNNYATNVEELGVGIAKLSPILSQMGFSFEESAGLITPVIEVFRSGDESARALRTGLLNLTSDLPRVAEALSAIGVSQKDANGEMRSGKDILLDVQTAWAGLTDNQKTYFTQLLAGKDQAAKMAVVFDTLEKQIQITNTAMAASGSIAAEVAARLKSAEVMVDRFKVGFENLGIAVGDQFRVAATGAVAGAVDIEAALADLVTAGAFDDLFDGLEDFSDRLGDFLKGVAKALPEAFAEVDFSGLLDALSGLSDEIGAFFGDLDLTDAGDLSIALQGVVDAVAGLINVTSGMAEQLKPVWDVFVEGVQRLSQADTEAQKTFGNLLGAAELVAVAGVKIAAAMAIIKESGADVENVFNAVIGSIKVVWNSMQVAFDSIAAGIVNLLYKINDALSDVTFGETSEGFAQKAADLKLLLEGIDLHQAEQMQELIDGATQAMDGFTGRTRDAADQVENFNDKIAEVPAEVETIVTIEADSDDAAEVQRLLEEDIPGTKDVTVYPVTDDMSFEEAYNALHGIAPDEKETNIVPKVDDAAAKAAADKVAAAMAAQKTMEVQATIDIANIEAGVERAKIMGETAQEAMKWSAKLDIAEVEANAKIMVSAFESVNNTINSTGDVLSTVFGMLDEDLSMQGTWAVLDQITAENELREKTFALQERLTESQIRYNDARTDAMERGDAMITINGDGLAPHLEAFMWEILSMIQVRANADGAEFLMGIS